MKPVFLVDYDYTLFDARKYKQEILFPTLSRTSHLDLKTIEDLWNKFIGEHGFLDIFQFSCVLSETSKWPVRGEPVWPYQIMREVRKIHTSPYLYEGARNLVQQLRELGPVIIYTRGDFTFQNPKIERSELLELSELTNEKKTFRLITPIWDYENEEKPEYVRETLNKDFTSIADSLSPKEMSVVVDREKSSHCGQFAVKLIQKGYSPWIIEDDASVLINAFEEVKRERPQEIERLNLIFMDQGPHAKKERPTSLPDTAYQIASSLGEAQHLILKRLQGEREIPPVKIS